MDYDDQDEEFDKVLDLARDLLQLEKLWERTEIEYFE